MRGVVRKSDIAIGVGTHGLPCCPHGITTWGTGTSGTVLANRRGVVRKSDIHAHNCPHCGISISLVASSKVLANRRGVCRRGDAVSKVCGGGSWVGASNDVRSN